MNHGIATSADLAARERTAQRWWLGGIIAFFAIQAMIWIAAISLTQSDLSHAVVPDYDQRAMHWDEYRAKLAASKALGWQADYTLTPVPQRMGRVRLELRLVDRTGAAIVPESVTLTIFHCARAAQQVEVRLQADESVLASETPMNRPGQWQLELEVSRGSERFFDRRRITVDREMLGLPVNRYLDPERKP